MAEETKPKAASATKAKAGGDAVTALVVKSDPGNAESPLIYAPEVREGAHADPEPVEVQAGETAAQHEAHVHVNSLARVQDRLEKEQEPGVTDVEVAQEQRRADEKLLAGRVTYAEPEAAAETA